MGRRISEIRLENWKNFRLADVKLQRRMFVIGPTSWMVRRRCCCCWRSLSCRCIRLW